MPTINFIQAINEALREEMRRDPGVFVMGEDVEFGAFGATRGLVEEFGKARVRNTPLSEAGFAGAGVGAAMAGLRPVVEIEFASFLYCCMDQICNQAAKLRYMSGGQARLALTYRCVFGAMGSAAAQHSETVYPQFLSVPGLKIVVPSGPADMKGLLKSAIRDDNPVLVFEHGRLGWTQEEVPQGDHVVALGQASIKHEGRDVTIVAIGLMVQKALEAVETLAAEGISAEVLDPRTLVPLDKQSILESVAKTGRLIIADEAHLTGSAASEIAAVVADEGFDYLDAPIKRVASADVPIPFAPALEAAVIPGADRIAEAARELCG